FKRATLSFLTQLSEIFQMDIGHSTKRIAIAFFVATLVVSGALGQQYKTDEIDPTLRAQGSVLKRYASDPNSDPSKKQLFENYITKYRIPMMTRSDPNALGDLGKDRYDLFRQYVWPAHPSVQAWMTS